MNYICTWLCADEKGDESYFPQTGMLSSSDNHQNIYWRCLVVFFISSKQFNKTEKHVFYTNVKKIPVVDDINIAQVLKQLSVEIIFTDFKYKIPKNYYSSFNNQFYEFSILEHIASHNKNQMDNYLILDTDCIFIKPAKDMFDIVAVKGYISAFMNFGEDHNINGITRKDMKVLYEELLGLKLSEAPPYHLGEFFLCNVENIRKIFHDFIELYPILLKKNQQGLKKFNEEAHTLSYLFYKNNLYDLSEKIFIRRIWTNPVFYRDASAKDMDLYIWHIPAEKNIGFKKLFYRFLKMRDYGLNMSNEEYYDVVNTAFGIPIYTLTKKINYYTTTCYNAIKKAGYHA